MTMPKGFYCDECDGYIAPNEEYIIFRGVNYCRDCFDTHKLDFTSEEEGTVFTCESCEEEITKGEYYRFDDEILCKECVEFASIETTEEQIWEGLHEDECF